MEDKPHAFLTWLKAFWWVFTPSILIVIWKTYTL